MGVFPSPSQLTQTKQGLFFCFTLLRVLGEAALHSASAKCKLTMTCKRCNNGSQCAALNNATPPCVVSH